MHMLNYKTFFLFLFLGTLVSFGPFITDMYLVALPSLMEYFKVSMPEVQLTLTSSLLGLASGQLVFGSIGDKFGRKRPLFAALMTFSLATFLCLFSLSFEVFILCRFMQGFAGAGSIVLARSMIPDLFERDVVLKAISVTTLIYTLNRIISPLFGGYAFELEGWKGIFIVLLFIGIILLAATFFMPETKPENTAPANIKESLRDLFHNKVFVYYTLAFTFVLTLQFAYIASCSFILQKHYLLTPLQYSYVFSFNAAVFGVGAFLPSLVKESAVVTRSICVALLAVCILLFFVPIINGNVYVYEILLIWLRLATGACFALFMAKALNACRAQSGLGAALLGTFYFLLGSLVTPLIGFGNIFYSSATIMSVFAVLTCYVVFKVTAKYKD